jgi:hypothetical protein
MEPMRPVDSTPLEYESPATRSREAGTSHGRRAAAAGCFGIGALVLGVPLAGWGFLQFIRNVWEVNRFVRSDAPLEATFALASGGALVGAAVRWVRAWRRTSRNE